MQEQMRFYFAALLSLTAFIACEASDKPPKAISPSVLASRLNRAYGNAPEVANAVDRAMQDSKRADLVRAELDGLRVRFTAAVDRVEWHDGFAKLYVARTTNHQLRVRQENGVRLIGTNRYDAVMSKDDAASIQHGQKLRIDAVLHLTAGKGLPVSESKRGQLMYRVVARGGHDLPWLCTRDYRLSIGRERLTPRWAVPGGHLTANIPDKE